MTPRRLAGRVVAGFAAVVLLAGACTPAAEGPDPAREDPAAPDDAGY